MIKILFVCHGNICRSTMAESVMTHLVIAAERLKITYDEEYDEERVRKIKTLIVLRC